MLFHRHTGLLHLRLQAPRTSIQLNVTMLPRGKLGLQLLERCPQIFVLARAVLQALREVDDLVLQLVGYLLVVRSALSLRATLQQRTPCQTAAVQRLQNDDLADTARGRTAC